VKFTLILATINRSTEVARFLESLSLQEWQDLELLLVDQNPNDFLEKLITPFKAMLPITHLRSAPGLSRSRNIGLAHATGDVVAFPDDDCWYSPGLLKQVAGFLSANPDWDGITGRSIDETGCISAGRWDTTPGLLNRRNVWRRGISFTIFLRRNVVRKVGLFDESLGAGAGTRWGSGEETDYLIRAIDSGFRLWFEPTLQVYHPQPTPSYGASTLHRARSYGRGMGHVLRKHRYPLWDVAYHCLRPLGGATLSIFKGHWRKAYYHSTVALGRWEGWWDQ
jgi:glycosyltransferase involved in cell wall biosynthesis